MNKQQLANMIWESANKMRSKIDANEYKDYILGFIFYKYLSSKEHKWLLERDYREEDIRNYVNEDDSETVNEAQQSLGYFIAYKDLFSTWIQMGTDFSVDNVRTALSAFNRLISPSHEKVFKGIFNTLDTGLSNLGDTDKAQSKAVRDLIHLIDQIPMDGRQDYDVLGFIYENLIEKFASSAGKKAGEFYTPHEVSRLMSEIVAWHLRGNREIKIYDPTSGSGSLLINIGKAVTRYMDDANRVRYYAQEINQGTYNLTRMNLVMRGILPDNIVTRRGDTLEEDWPYFDDSDPAGTYDPLYVDAVVSNPPYSQKWNPEGKENDPRYSRYGLAPKSKADYAFLLHDLYHLKPQGIMNIVLPHGVLFRGGEEGEIRKNLVENNNIDAIIGLPANIFYGTGIPTIIMILRQKRENKDILIIDASKGFMKDGKKNKLRACDIRKIVDTVISRKDVSKYARKVSLEEVRNNDYNLNIPRYVDSSEEVEHWDVYASMFGGIPEYELSGLNDFWKEFPSLKDDLFDSDGHFASLKTKDIKETILKNKDVVHFLQKYNNSFSALYSVLYEALVADAEHVSIIKTEDQIADALLRKFEEVPLIDSYEAYELFHNAYNQIEGDLELIQDEGIETITHVDPNMVMKKKNNREQEVQEGSKGHIIPFAIVQEACLKEEMNHLAQKEERLNEIPSEAEQLLEDMTEDEKDFAGDAVDQDKNSWGSAKEIKAVLKELKVADDESYASVIAKLEVVEALKKEESKLKKEVKKEKADFEILTKNMLEQMSLENAKKLLGEKWITPISRGIEKLPENLVQYLINKVETLSKKYETTFMDLEKEIHETEGTLSSMLSDLTGSDYDMKGISELQKLLKGDF